jgi:hypothetical protein
MSGFFSPDLFVLSVKCLFVTQHELVTIQVSLSDHLILLNLIWAWCAGPATLPNHWYETDISTTVSILHRSLFWRQFFSSFQLFARN